MAENKKKEQQVENLEKISIYSSLWLKKDIVLV